MLNALRAKESGFNFTLTPVIPIGHLRPLVIPSEFLSLNSFEWPVYGEQLEARFGSTRPRAAVAASKKQMLLNGGLLIRYLPFSLVGRRTDGGLSCRPATLAM